MKKLIKLNHFSKPSNLANDIVFLDGITRSGKLLLGSLVSSFNRMESFELGESFEHFMAALRVKRTSLDFSEAFLGIYLNQTLYNKMISRNVNFRRSDKTSIFKFRDPNLYKQRINKKEGSDVIKRIKKEKPIFPLVTHDIMCSYNLFSKLNFNVKFIEIYRNPFELVYSWYKRGHSKRMGKDPIHFTILLKNKKKKYPWYLSSLPKKWKNLNEIEKCSYFVIQLINESITNQSKIVNKSKILTTSYEKITEDTFNELNKISKFLKTSLSKKTKNIIKKSNCPNFAIKKQILKKKLFIKKNISEDFYINLEKLEMSYNKNIYGFRKND